MANCRSLAANRRRKKRRKQTEEKCRENDFCRATHCGILSDSVPVGLLHGFMLNDVDAVTVEMESCFESPVNLSGTRGRKSEINWLSVVITSRLLYLSGR
jgi:hypothetical protein